MHVIFSIFFDKFYRKKWNDKKNTKINNTTLQLLIFLGEKCKVENKIFFFRMWGFPEKKSSNPNLPTPPKS